MGAFQKTLNRFNFHTLETERLWQHDKTTTEVIFVNMFY